MKQREFQVLKALFSKLEREKTILKEPPRFRCPRRSSVQSG